VRFSLDLTHHPWTREPQAQAPRQTLATAAAADTAGIDAIWVSEDPEGWDAFAVLGALATVTGRAELGTSVTSPYPRHPNLLAASVATIDRLSAGRAVLGLGRGQVEWHRDALGVDTGEPLAALWETVELLRDWWSADRRASSPPEGHFQVRDWERVIAPAREQVPIYLAAVGPRTLELAGAIGDGVIFNSLSSEAFLTTAIRRVRHAATAAGRDPAALAFILRSAVTVVTDADAERRALDRHKQLFALIAPLPGMDRLVRDDEFDVASLLRGVRSAMRTDEILYAGGGFPALRREGDLRAARELIPDALIHRLGMIGPLPLVQERLQRLADIGVTYVAVAPPAAAASVESWRRLLDELRI
jgi:alkanesulfonate monooxygenase SsuD/methylene tetrahydromethanopterin reductase-like flavin-dependent oxidoreductase (luciferase family)